MKKIFTNIFIASLFIILIFNILDDKFIHNPYFSTFTNIGFLIILLIYVIVYLKSLKSEK